VSVRVRITLSLAAILPVIFVSAMRAQTAPAGGCAALAGHRLPNTTITTVEAITSGSLEIRHDRTQRTQ
jgi:hypothetical protein